MRRLMYWIMFHAVKKDKFSKVVITSSNTNVCVRSLHHFRQWMCFGLNELWIISGKNNSINVTPVYLIVNNMDNMMYYMQYMH